MSYSFDPGIWSWIDQDQQPKQISFFPRKKDSRHSDASIYVQTIDISASSKLNFDHPIASALRAVECKKYQAVLWQMDLIGCRANTLFDPLDVSCVQTLKLAMCEFIQQLPPILLEHTFGVSIDSVDLLKPVRSHCDPGKIVWNHRMQEFLSLYIRDQLALKQHCDFASLAPIDRALFTLQLHDSLWSLLASHCPDHWQSFIHIQETNLTQSEQAFLLTRDLFEHLVPIAESVDPRLVPIATVPAASSESVLGTVLPIQEEMRGLSPRVGVLSPDFAASSKDEFMSFFDQVLVTTPAAFRLIPESRLMHLWQDLEWVVCPFCVRDRQTIRQMKGFEAAGGTALFYEATEEIGMAQQKLMRQVQEILR